MTCSVLEMTWNQQRTPLGRSKGREGEREGERGRKGGRGRER